MTFQNLRLQQDLKKAGQVSESQASYVKEYDMPVYFDLQNQQVFSPSAADITESQTALIQNMQKESQLEYKSKDWAKVDIKRIDMFAVKMQQEGGFNVKSFNKVSKHTLAPTQKVIRKAFEQYKKI